MLTGTLTTHDSHHRGFSDNADSQHFTHFLHYLITTHRTVIAIQLSLLYARLGKGSTAGIAATATIGSGQTALNLIDSGILLNLKFGSDHVQNHRQQSAEYSHQNDSPNNST
jgi:hypothetical protein